jgi:hypothetical protein
LLRCEISFRRLTARGHESPIWAAPDLSIPRHSARNSDRKLKPLLFDHLVGAGKQGRWDSEAEHFRDLVGE